MDVKQTVALSVGGSSLIITIGSIVYFNNKIKALETQLNSIQDYIKRIEEGTKNMDVTMNTRLNQVATNLDGRVKLIQQSSDTLKQGLKELQTISNKNFQQIQSIVQTMDLSEEEQTVINKLLKTMVVKKEKKKSSKEKKKSSKEKKKVRFVNDSSSEDSSSEDSSSEDSSSEEEETLVRSKSKKSSSPSSSSFKFDESNDDEDRKKLELLRQKKRQLLQSMN